MSRATTMYKNVGEVKSKANALRNFNVKDV